MLNIIFSDDCAVSHLQLVVYKSYQLIILLEITRWMASDKILEQKAWSKHETGTCGNLAWPTKYLDPLLSFLWWHTHSKHLRINMMYKYYLWPQLLQSTEPRYCLQLQLARSCLLLKSNLQTELKHTLTKLVVKWQLQTANFINLSCILMQLIYYAVHFR